MNNLSFHVIFIVLWAGVIMACNTPQSKKSEAGSSFGENTVNGGEMGAETEVTNPNDYRLALEKLDPGDLSSLSIAGNLLRNSKADTMMRDSLFVVFNDFYISVAANYAENNESVSTQLAGTPSVKELNLLKTNLASYGIRLVPAEGTISLEPEMAFLYGNYGGGLSMAYREFLNIRAKEQQQPLAQDGLLLISVDSLASRILEWENFIALYPDFIAIRIAQDQYAEYLAAFLAGIDNSRVFNAETNKLNDSARRALESFVAQHPASLSAEIVKSYLGMLETTNFNYTEKVDSFLLARVYQ